VSCAVKLQYLPAIDSNQLTINYLDKDSQALKKSGHAKKHHEKNCEIQGGGQEVTVMVALNQNFY